jgi:DNA mismatch repair protein MutS2
VKPSDLLDAGSAHVLGFDWLVAAVAPLSCYGERLFADLVPYRAGEETRAQARAQSIAGFASLGLERLDALRAALGDLPDVTGTIARATIGDLLEDPDFLEISRFCSTIAHIDELLPARSGRWIANEAVLAAGAALDPGSSDGIGFYLADAFDAELPIARERLGREQAELDAARGRERERAAQGLGREEISGDEFIVMRADLHAPLPEGVRVVREAPTYLLCALEFGDASLAALESRDAAADDAGKAEERVRVRLSANVALHADGLIEACSNTGEIDILVAAARFALRYRCTPAALEAEPMLAFEQARFLPLEEELASAGRRFVPLDLALHDAAVLTGPNMGGKSVSLQTCGFVALCAAFGLPVPAARARSSLFDQIAWLGLGRDAQAGGLLSSFAREVLELKEILARAAPRLLILGDEFARTTTPREGKALLVALLERLRERGARGLLATHLDGIADAAGVRHFAVRGLRAIPSRASERDVEAALDALAQAMDYTIAEVKSDGAARADAIALTALLGLDGDFVDAAYRALVE